MGGKGPHVDRSQRSSHIPSLDPHLNYLADAPRRVDTTVSRWHMTLVGLGDNLEASPGRQLSPTQSLPPNGRSP